MLILHIVVLLIGLSFLIPRSLPAAVHNGGLLIVATVVVIGWIVRLPNLWAVDVYLFALGAAISQQNGTHSRAIASALLWIALAVALVGIFA